MLARLCTLRFTHLQSTHQLSGQTRQAIAATPEQPEREDYEYQRLGVCNVFMACAPLAGRRLTKVTKRRAKINWHFTTESARIKLKRLYPTFEA